MFTCLPSKLPKQLGKFQSLQKLAATVCHWATVGDGRKCSCSAFHNASHVSVTILEAVELAILKFRLGSRSRPKHIDNARQSASHFNKIRSSVATQPGGQYGDRVLRLKALSLASDSKPERLTRPAVSSSSEWEGPEPVYDDESSDPESLSPRFSPEPLSPASSPEPCL
uniref:Uncharacterized protein n=1 Tax=Knipowitschia caucasica TaxID=637954 RepID=A0AAV2MN48_KNICA